MTIFYSANTTVKIDKENYLSEAVQKILKELNEISDGNTEYSYHHEKQSLAIYLNSEMSYSTAGRVDELFEELGEYIIGASVVSTSFDDEHEELYIGKDDKEKEELSTRNLINSIKIKIDELNMIPKYRDKGTVKRLYDILDEE